MSVEPSMEDILSSIKRIIAEEGDAAPARPRKARSPAPATVEDEPDQPDAAPILELNDPMPPPQPQPRPQPQPLAQPPSPAAAATPRRDLAPAVEPPPAAEPILSHQAMAATRGSLDTLSRLMVKPDPAGDGTLEGLVREMLRPMLREWLDANLPAMVETMVAREIASITGRPG